MNQEISKRIFSSIILLPFVILIIITGSFIFNFFLILCLLISVYEWHLMTKKIIKKYLGILFITLSFYSIFKIRNSIDGEYIYLLLITFICISTDIGGYLFGKLLKGPKLTKISPNKTFSGMLGSFLLPLIMVYFFSETINFDYSYKINLEIVTFTILVSAVSQFGDITVSYFKRVSNIKDTGKIIPGHGGLLDRIDGMIFAYPFSYSLIVLFDLRIF